MKKYLLLVAAMPVMLFFYSCKKQNDSFTSPSINAYFPLQVGKYITYDLDSLVFINFGATDSMAHYQVKYYTEDTFQDNLGRTAYRIIRYIRRTPDDEWINDHTFMAVNTGHSLEWTEDNLRFIKLVEPFGKGFNWQGNTYIDTYTYQSDVPYLDNWKYTYDSINQPFMLSIGTVDSTIKVAEQNQVTGFPDDPNYYSEIIYSAEYYAKGIGLIYRHFLYQEHQPPVNGNSGYNSGYGVTLSMIDHN